MPAAEIVGRIQIVAHGNAQDEKRHKVRMDEVPGAVIPAAGIPVVVKKHPVHAVIEEIVRRRPRCVIDRVAGYRHEFRKDRQTDANAHLGRTEGYVHLCRG